MKLTAAILFGLWLVVSCSAQANQSKPDPQPGPSFIPRQIVELPAPQRAHSRPDLTLQAALKLSERYIAKQRIDISRYYLYEAKFILYGSKDNQDPCWVFQWVKDDSTIGDYVEIVVSIKTKNVFRLPTM